METPLRQVFGHFGQLPDDVSNPPPDVLSFGILSQPNRPNVFLCLAQDFTFDADKQAWDGVTPPSQNVLLSPSAVYHYDFGDGQWKIDNNLMSAISSSNFRLYLGEGDQNDFLRAMQREEERLAGLNLRDYNAKSSLDRE